MFKWFCRVLLLLFLSHLSQASIKFCMLFVIELTTSRNFYLQKKNERVKVDIYAHDEYNKTKFGTRQHNNIK